MSKECPATMQETHSEDIKTLYSLSLPEWARGTAITLIGLLFILYGGIWFYLITNYPTKDDMKEMRAEVRQDLREIKEALNSHALASKEGHKGAP